MTLFTALNRASTGTVIPDGVSLVSFGSYFSAKNSSGDSRKAALIDELLGSFSNEELRKLSNELTNSFGDILTSYTYLHNHSENFNKNSQEISDSRTHRSYNTYVTQVSIKRVTMLRALSLADENVSKKDLSFVFDEGVLKVEMGAKKMFIPEAKKYCEDVYVEKGLKVEVKVESIMENVAKKSFDNDEVAIHSFMQDKNKEVGGIKLKESAELFLNGKLNGRVGSIRACPMQEEVQVYLTSANNLQAIYVDSQGKNMSGLEISAGSEFISGGADLYRLGVNNLVTSAIISSVYLSPETTDQDAKAIFDTIMLAPEEKMPEYCLFNYSWLAEEYSRNKGNESLLLNFCKKYKHMLRSLPLYCGTGCFKYILKFNAYKNPFNVNNFFKLPKVVEKLIGHYNVMASFYPRTTLKLALKTFFDRNVSVINDYVKPMFNLYLDTHTFVMPKQGRTSNSGWDDDGSTPLAQDSSEFKELEYVKGDSEEIEYIRSLSYGSDRRLSSNNNYVPEKNPRKIENVSGVEPLRNFVNREYSNISQKSTAQKLLVGQAEVFHNDFFTRLKEDDFFDVHLAFGAALFTQVPELITQDMLGKISTGYKPFGFSGSEEGKFASLCSDSDLADSFPVLWSYVEKHVPKKLEWFTPQTTGEW